MEKPVESDSASPHSGQLLRLRLLGPLTVSRGREELRLPSSRKVRALLGYLALQPGAVTRSHLCELFWDVPNDPRGELRWCLSKIRALVDEPARKRVAARGDKISLDLSDCSVDALDLSRAVQGGLDGLVHADKRALAEQSGGEVLEGEDPDRNPAFAAWLTGQRRRFRGMHAALLDHLATHGPAEESLEHLEKLSQIVPFDRGTHEKLLMALAARGRLQEGEKHLEATARSFEQEGLDSRPLADAWKLARATGQRSAAAATASAEPRLSEPQVEDKPAAPRRASIAVMPFVDYSIGDGPRGGTGDALAHDVITRLAKLRSLFVIAQGTVFALDQRRIGPQDAGRILNVDYIVSGSFRNLGSRVSVGVELAETRTARVIWAEVLSPKVEDTFSALDEIGDRIVASIASEIEVHERNRAILQPPATLDAWAAYHRGLWHMYRFDRSDNDEAYRLFERAVLLDPTFARAHAGLSFTHWQRAFQGWGDRARETELAYGAASQSLMADDRDPAAHWAMGRALWLRGQPEDAIAELDQSVALSPNFAFAHYNLAFLHSTSGDASAAVSFADHSRALSPFDPMLFGMLAARALALVRLGRFEEAAQFGIKAAARPNAHAHIHGIAAFCLALAGRIDDAQPHLAAIRRANPNYALEDFLRAFQLDEAGAAAFARGAKLIGLR